MAAIRAVRGARNELYTRRADARTRAPLHRRGGRRRRGLLGAPHGRLHHEHAPRPRALPGEGRGARPDVRGAARQGGRATATARADRCTSPIRPPATSARTPSSAAARARDRRRVRGASAAAGSRRRLLLRRGRARPGRAVRSHEPGAALEAAGRSTSARTTCTTSTRTSSRRPRARSWRRPAAFGMRRRGRRPGRAGRVRRGGRARGAGAQRRRPGISALNTYRFPAITSATSPARTTAPRRRKQRWRRARSDRAARRAGCARRVLLTRRRSTRSRGECALPRSRRGRRIRAGRAVSRIRAR